MCQFISGVVTKKETLFDLDSDSHEELIRKAGLDDKTGSPDFVRVELIPEDNDVFNHNPDNWQLKIDQDFKPAWFNEKFAETEMKKALKQIIAERFIIGKTIKELDNGRYFIKNSEIEKLCNSVFVQILINSNIGVMRESSNVGVMWGSSNVGVMWGSSNIGVMRESSRVGEMWGSSNVGVMRESSNVGEMRGSSNVGVYSENVVYKTINDNGIAILYYKDNPEIIVANPKITLTQF